MRKTEKLFKKISKVDRERLVSLLEKLTAGEHKNLNIAKIKDSDLYRLRTGRFRIIFHYEEGKIVVDNIRLRSEKTYKGL